MGTLEPMGEVLQMPKLGGGKSMDEMGFELKVRSLEEKLQRKAFRDKLSKDAPRALKSLGFQVLEDFPKKLELDVSVPLLAQIPWDLVLVPTTMSLYLWGPWWPWWWFPRRERELPLQVCCCDCKCCC